MLPLSWESELAERGRSDSACAGKRFRRCVICGLSRLPARKAAFFSQLSPRPPTTISRQVTAHDHLSDRNLVQLNGCGVPQSPSGVAGGRFCVFRTRECPCEVGGIPRIDRPEEENKNEVNQSSSGGGLRGLFGAMLAPVARADDWNRKTVITFSGPVEIPGVHLKGWGVLPAGTYVFKILDSASDRHIVQIFNKDETTIYATILAIPNYRLKATDKTVMTFRERRPASRKRCAPGSIPAATGAKNSSIRRRRRWNWRRPNAPVLFTPVEIPVEVAEPIKSADAPVVAELKNAPDYGDQAHREEVVLAAGGHAAAGTNVQMAPATLLPQTASSLPLIGLFGLADAGWGASSIRAAANRLSRSREIAQRRSPGEPRGSHCRREGDQRMRQRVIPLLAPAGAARPRPTGGAATRPRRAAWRCSIRRCLNKGTAFTAEEREGAGPDRSASTGHQHAGTQVKRAYIQYERLPDALSKNIYLTALHDRNEVLFYRLFSEHLREMIPDRQRSDGRHGDGAVPPRMPPSAGRLSLDRPSGRHRRSLCQLRRRAAATSI